MKPQVLLVRHGSTALNEGAERVRGYLDIPLSAKGEAEALQVALKLQDYAVGHVYCSPLLRARQTARPICAACHAPLVLEKKLLPWMLGSKIQGKLVAEVLPLIKHYANQPNDVPPGGEPFKAFSDRFLSFLSDIIFRAQRAKDVVLVAHSRNVQLAKAWEAAGRPKDFSYDVGVMNAYDKEMPNGQILALDCVIP